MITYLMFRAAYYRPAAPLALLLAGLLLMASCGHSTYDEFMNN